MKRLFIVDKSQVAAEMIRAGVINKEFDDYISVVGIGYQQFKIPRNLPFSDAPFVLEPEYKSRSLFVSACNKQYGAHLYSSLGVYPESKLTDIVDQVKERISEYGEIIICSYDDYRSLYYASDTLKLLLSGIESKIKVTRASKLLALDAESLHRSIANREPFNSEEHYIKYAEAKYYFDWLWSINSASVFGMMFKHLGIHNERIFSKNELLVLHLISKGKLHHAASRHYRQMNDYAGTGKYKVLDPLIINDEHQDIALGYLPEEIAKTQPLECGIGSISSRMEILSQLENRGLIKSLTRLELTDSGQKLLTYMHKDTFDPDLPFRIQLWSKTGNKVAIERYVTKFFAKQKRFFLSQSANDPIRSICVQVNHERIASLMKKASLLDEVSAAKITADTLEVLNK